MKNREIKQKEIFEIGFKAKNASYKVASLDSKIKNDILYSSAENLKKKQAINY